MDIKKELKKIFEDYFKEWLFFFPLEGSFWGFNTLDEIEEIPINISEEFRKRERDFYLNYKNKLKKIDVKNLDQELITYKKTFEFILDINLRELKFKTHLLPINHYLSYHLIFPSLCLGNLNQSFKDNKDVENFRKKIHYFEKWTEEIIKNLNKGIKEKITLPFVVVEKIIIQIEDILKKRGNSNPLFHPLFLIRNDFKGKDKEKYINLIEKEIKEKVFPSYLRIYEFLKEIYIKNCSKEIGLAFLPKGIEWYEMEILKNTTLKLNPEKIHIDAKKKLEELKKENIKFKKETFKGDYINLFENLKRKIKGELKNYFIELPKRDFKIMPLEKHREKTSSLGEYYVGGSDKKNLPTFNLNLNLAKKRDINEIYSIFFHETIPGHHLQISLVREKEDMPSFAKYTIFNSFVEGWALYSEKLAEEIGLIGGENYKKVIIKNQIWRTLRLIIDTGIHLGKIRKEEATDLLVKEGNFKRNEAEIEVLRYSVLPAQALTYKIGEDFILNLRNKAEKKLKEKFNLKDFHRVLLENGSIPLKILEEKFENWIKNIV